MLNKLQNILNLEYSLQNIQFIDYVNYFLFGIRQWHQIIIKY